MKTKEFIKAVKKLGYYPLENNAIIKIAKSQTIPLVYADVATKHRNALQTYYFPFTELTSEKQAELFDVLIEYARTPIEEREEEPRYRLAQMVGGIKMKIYQTETQADFDALMIELDKQGCKLVDGDKTTELTGCWEVYSSETCVKVCKKVVKYSKKSYYTSAYPNVRIIKYKAEDDKMRFTKENVYRLFRDYRINKHGISVLANLESAIMDLDDTPEKVVVPKCFDEWYKEIEAKYQIPDSAKTFALWKLCQQGFGCSFEDIRGKKIPYETDLGEWLFKNKMLAIDAVLYGYTIEPEKLYCIPLPDLETADGTKQYLTKSGAGNYFALSPCVGQKQRYTKEELAQVPEIYKPFVKPIEEESK